MKTQEHTKGKIKTSGTVIQDKDNRILFCCSVTNDTEYPEDILNAAHIVRCWNNHYMLLEACKEALNILASYKYVNGNFTHRKEVVNMQQAIKKAEEGQS